MKHILIMETGSFKVMGGAAKDTYKIYRKLRLRKDYDVDILGDFSKIDPSVKTVSQAEALSKNYDLVWMNSIRDVGFAENYMRKHQGNHAKFLYVDRGNILLNFRKAGIKKLLPKMVIRRYLTSRMEMWLDYYIAISTDQYSHAKSFFSEKTDVRYIMIAPHEEYRALSAKRSFTGALSVSRLDERQKKISFMIRGIARVKEQHTQLKNKLMLKIVGTGVDEANYKNLAKSLGLEKNVRFEGFMIGEGLIKEYNNAGFFVSTSEWEGLGRSLLEAMACGLPLLINDNINTAIKADPLTRIVKDGSNGLVYGYGDMEGFANAFYKLYSDKSLQKKLSSNAMVFMKQFRFGKVVRSYEKLIDDL